MFNVTYDILTPESAENGEAEESGFIVQDATLREALDAVRDTRTSACGGIEAIEPNSSHGHFSWITVYNGMEYETGAQESRSIHIPDSVTMASRKRIAKLLGCKIRG